MRPWLVSEVACELLGPASGQFEIIKDRPDLKYSLGILSPKKQEHSFESTNYQSMITDGSSNYEGEDSVSEDDAPPAPWIDPTAKPSSMGLSFTCTSDNEIPSFDVCLTYARYEYNPETDNFNRSPRAMFLDWNSIVKKIASVGNRHQAKIWLTPIESGGNCRRLIVCEKNDAEVGLSITIRNKFMDTNLWSITLLIDSQILPRKEEEKYDANMNSELNIHQPEIRISMNEGSELEEFSPSTSNTDEDSIDAMLYAGRGQRARGHLCSVVWKDFDPQQIESEVRSGLFVISDNEERVNFGEKPPFAWVDNSLEPLAKVSEKFYPPCVRTEYLPMLNIAAPEMNPKWDNETIFSAQKLSEATTPEAIEELLSPLISGYRSWIENSFDETVYPHHRTLVIEAKAALVRMEKGVQLLKSNSDARLAFNFANKSLEVNSQWVNDRPLNWRKFQLSFALSVLESTTNPNSTDREHLDLLWVATGGGKTEAYLLVTAYILAFKRLVPNGHSWQGVNVLTRYTLRLLTIQQYRRALGMITAMEWLRNSGKLNDTEINLGKQTFSIGIWVGGSVTSNKISSDDKIGHEMKTNWKLKIKNDLREDYLQTHKITAIQSLSGGNWLSDSRSRNAAEPAQILNCPCCKTVLSFTRATDDTSRKSKQTIHWIVETNSVIEQLLEIIVDDSSIPVTDAKFTHHHSNLYSLELSVNRPEGVDEQSVEGIWRQIKFSCGSLGAEIKYCSTRPSRPGYFFRTYRDARNKQRIYDFEIRCPNPTCELNKIDWQAASPSGSANGRQLTKERLDASHEGVSVEIIECWRKDKSNSYIARGCPIPAYTVDQQIYRHLPQLIIATADKFARMPFEPMTGGLFGNITHHHEIFGFVRAGSGMKKHADELPNPNAKVVELTGGLESPSLIIQDELHLIEGPLGSMTGFYETVVEELIREGSVNRNRPKYIASTATIRSATEQIRCLFDRQVHLFPPKGPNWKDRGLLIENDQEPTHSEGEYPGRLYMGFCPIGVSALGVQRDVYANILHAGKKTSGDRYWSVVGYYNAVRELAGARALIEQDVVGKLNLLASSEGGKPRELNLVELSGIMVSSDLPILLDQLENSKRDDDGCVDVLLTTSMFGTGVDVNRLNLMFVAGQPKTTAQYIQATGRVGRKNGALITTFLRGSRPRDLDHYERFLSYHLQIHRFVEPVTVRPFSMAVLERAAGPLSVAWLRNSRVANSIPWRMKNSASQWNIATPKPSEFDKFIEIIESRNRSQILERQIVSRPPNAIRSALDSGWEKWAHISDLAAQKGVDVNWVNYHLSKVGRNPPPPETFVVLGDERHVRDPENHKAAYSPHYSAPQSLRAVDSTIGVQTRGR